MSDQWIRRIGLVVSSGDVGLDLSNFHVKFEVANADMESPNNCSIRIYNMSKETVNRLTEKGEFTKVTLNAGYINGNYGVIFQGDIIQYRVGKESNVDSYLDILAADGDYFYNHAFLSASQEKGSNSADMINAAAKESGVPVQIKYDAQHVPSIRGKVQFGMAKDLIRNEAKKLNASWSIQGGVVTVMQNNLYLNNEIVELNAQTGLIGLPEQTDEGIRIRCLLNSKLRIGGTIKINNSIINQTLQADKNRNYQKPYNSIGGYQPLAPLSQDGQYQIFVCEYTGDTRGTPWYTDIIGLAIDSTNQTVVAQ